MKLYIIGPVTGMENENIEEFYRVKRKIWDAKRYEVTVPHEFILSETPWDIAMLCSIHKMTASIKTPWGKTRRFDGIAMLDGWEDSKGACLEKQVADAIGIPCKPWEEWLQCE